MVGGAAAASSASACTPLEMNLGGRIPRPANSSDECSGGPSVTVRTAARSGKLSASQLGDSSPNSVSLVRPPDDKVDVEVGGRVARRQVRHSRRWRQWSKRSYRRRWWASGLWRQLLSKQRHGGRWNRTDGDIGGGTGGGSEDLVDVDGRQIVEVGRRRRSP